MALPDDLISINEAASLVPGNRKGKKTHVSTIYRWMNDGKIHGWKIGQRYVVSRTEILNLFRPVEAAEPIPSKDDAWADKILAECGYSDDDDAG